MEDDFVAWMFLKLSNKSGGEPWMLFDVVDVELPLLVEKFARELYK